MSTMISQNGNKHDVIIVGAGPGGAASALYLLKAGFKPLMLDKEEFPRYHIGESLTGECGVCLRELGLEASMMSAGYPIKHGVNVYGTEGKNSFWVPVARRDTKNKLQPARTWQVKRSSFDEMLLKTARERGAEFVQGQAVTPLVDVDRITGVRIEQNGRTMDFQSEVLIDASGSRTFLASKSGLTSKKERGSYDKQIAVFSQVVDAIRDPGDACGNTLIFYKKKNYWAWFIPIDDEVVSVGVVVPGEYFNAQRLSKPDFLQKELRILNPELSKRVPNLNFVEDVRTISNYSYHIKNFTGKGFLCVGDSHRFIDPVFSFGLYFALKEAQFAAQAIQKYFSGEANNTSNPFSEYQTLADVGQDIIQGLLDTFWEFPWQFLLLVHNSHRDEMIDYFAGRVYGKKVKQSPGVLSMQRVLAKRNLPNTKQSVN